MSSDSLPQLAEEVPGVPSWFRVCLDTEFETIDKGFM